MASYVISCCSTADLPEEYMTRRNISYVCMHFSLDGRQYQDDLGKSVPHSVFYDAMRAGSDVKTSQVNAGEFMEYFMPFLEQGKDIIHVSMSSGFSGTYNSAMIAKEQLQQQFPDRKIYIVDSLCGSCGYGMAVEKLADLRDEGKTIEECFSWAEEHILNVNAWFFVSDLKYLIQGGRISKTAGFLGSLLQICPLITADTKGKLVSKHKIRTKTKAISELVKKMEESAFGGLDYRDVCYVCHAGCVQDAQKVAELISEKFPNLRGKVRINNIGTTMGSHCGPGTVALFYWGEKRTD